MEQTCAGGKWWYLNAGCIAGAIAVGLLSGPAMAVTLSLTIHVCAAYIMSEIEVT